MADQADLAGQFERARDHLRDVAYRMLGSLDEAEDAVQEAWLRASRADVRDIGNVTGWLTTIVARICLDFLRARRRRERRLGEERLEAVLDLDDIAHPTAEAELAESVGLALLVVLDRLGPAERVAFVLHDMFAVPFEQIATILERSPAAAKKLASRARHRVRGSSSLPATELARQRSVVESFLAASRAGDIDALLAILAPDVVRRADGAARRGDAPEEVRGARRVAEETLSNARLARFARPALVDGRIGAVVAPRGRLLFVLAITVEGNRVTAIDVTGAPARLREIDLRVVDLVGIEAGISDA